MKSISCVKLFLLDMDGTVYLGDSVFPWTLPFLRLVREQGKKFVFLTNNSSKSRFEYAEKLAKMRFDVPPEDIFTSGEATTMYLSTHKPDARVYLAGTPELMREFSDAGFILTEYDPDYAVLGFDKTLTYDKIEKLCRFISAGKPFIATHPDLVCPSEEGFIPDVGSMLAMIKAATGRTPDTIIGKPDSYMIDACLNRYRVKRDEVCIVGDRLTTDIAAGKNSGIISALVMSGETTAEILKKSEITPDFVFDNLSDIAAAIR